MALLNIVQAPGENKLRRGQCFFRSRCFRLEMLQTAQIKSARHFWDYSRFMHSALCILSSAHQRQGELTVHTEIRLHSVQRT